MWYKIPFESHYKQLGKKMSVFKKIFHKFSGSVNLGRTDVQSQSQEVICFRNMILEKLVISLRNDPPENNLCTDYFINGEPAHTDYFYHFLVNFTDNISKFFDAYQKLEDKASKDLFIDLILYRILGHKFIKLPTNNEKHFRDRELAKSFDVGPSSLLAGSFGKPLRHFEFDYRDYKIKFDGDSASVAWSFFIKQYRLERENINIMPERGDYVFDLGSCFGDTAIGFAADVGQEGKVFSFDFLPAHEKVFKFNIEQNPKMLNQVVFCPYAVGDIDDFHKVQKPSEAEQKIMPGASLVYGNVDTSNIPTITIDTYVKNNNITKVDYIKMDIEGYELNALKGAKTVLERYKPKLGISAYHRNEDFYVLMKYIDQLNLGYKFYFDHYTTHGCETVLYASVGGK
ncbi:MAG: FkbM family methyltransferase [Gammaproteobacteria bacterium]|nr:FkbM family methyltransferase [Gammaproteobacteria bacterium]